MTGRRIAGWGLGLLVLAAGGWGIFILSLNVALQTGALPRWIGQAQKVLTLSFEADWTWSPGHLAGRDLRLVIHDRAVQAELFIDAFAVEWRPWALLSRRFHATEVDARGVRFRLRKTRMLDDLCAQPTGLPVITGQSLPPELVGDDCGDQLETALPPGPKPKRDRVFTVELEGATAADVEEIWIERYRARGTGSFEGSWRFVPTFATALEGLRVDFEGWEIARDTEAIIGAARLHGGAEVEPLDLREGSKWDRNLSFTGTVALQQVGAARIAAPFLRGSQASVSGALDVYVDAQLDRGRPRYVATLLEGHTVARIQDRTVRARPRLSLRLQTPKTSSATRLSSGRLTLHELRLGAPDAPPTEVHAIVSDDSWFTIHPPRISLGLLAETSNLEPLMQLLSGLPQVMIDLLVRSSVHIKGEARLEARPGDVVVEGIEVEAGTLSAKGQVRVAPELDGQIEAKLGPVKVTKKLGRAAD